MHWTSSVIIFIVSGIHGSTGRDVFLDVFTDGHCANLSKSILLSSSAANRCVRPPVTQHCQHMPATCQTTPACQCCLVACRANGVHASGWLLGSMRGQLHKLPQHQAQVSRQWRGRLWPVNFAFVCPLRSGARAPAIVTRAQRSTTTAWGRLRTPAGGSTPAWAE